MRSRSATYLPQGGDIYLDNITFVDNSMSPEAVKIADEIRKNTIKDIIGNFKVKNNLFEGVVVCIGNNMSTQGYLMVTIYFKFVINNKECIFKENIDYMEYTKQYTSDEAATQKCFEYFMKIVSRLIAIEFVKII